MSTSAPHIITGGVSGYAWGEAVALKAPRTQQDAVPACLACTRRQGGTAACTNTPGRPGNARTHTECKVNVCHHSMLQTLNNVSIDNFL